MDWTLILLVLILIALWSIKDAIDKIANKPMPQQPYPPQFPSLDGIEHQLKNIFKIMGGETKTKEERLKKHKVYYSTLVKALILSGKTPKQAEEEASGYLEENEFDETLGEDYLELMHYAHPEKAMSALKWAKAQLIDERNKKKYGHLLREAGKYIQTVDQIEKYEHKMQEVLKTDWDGEQWLIKKLLEEKKLEEIREYNPEGADNIKGWKVVKT